MANEEPTIPPRQPNTIRTFLTRAVAFARVHPDWLVVFVLGFVAGAALL